MRKYLYLLLIAWIFITFQPRAFASDWIEVTPITDKVIMLRFLDGYIEHHGYREAPSTDVVYNVPLDLTKAASLISYSITSSTDPDYSSPVNPILVGRKTKGEDFSKNCQDTAKCPFVNTHYIFLHLAEPLKDGQTYTIDLDGLALNYNSSTLQYDYKNTRSDAVKVNQRGYIPAAEKKFAYISYWLGDNGPLNLDDYAGKKFWLVNVQSGQEEFEGTINKRLDFESGTGQKDLLQPDDPAYFANADVWECDFSAFQTPGIYVVAVEGVGTSYPFKVDSDVYREAYYHTTRALYHHRTGIALEPEYTSSHRPRTLHPEDSIVKFQYTTSRWIDWNGTENGDKNTVLSQVDPNVKLTTYGWYMDAGDWDGYYSHTVIPRYLMMAFDLAPEKFSDGELNIPESGNGIPDILDEAAWIINYLDRTRGPSGGIAGVRVHPDFNSGSSNRPSWEDTRTWLISGEDYVTTFTFAGLAAYLAHCYRSIDREDLATPWWNKALTAYNWANDRVVPATDNLYNSRLLAAAAMYKYSGLAVFQSHFIADFAKTGDNDPANNRRWATWTYLTSNHANINITQRNSCMASARSWADSEIIDPADKRSFRVGFNWYLPYVVGQPTTPAVFPALVMYFLTQEQKYLTASITSADYYLGGNPLNITWMTGVGHHRPERVLHIDTWYHPDGREFYPPGIVPYGPNINYNFNDYIVYSGEFAPFRVYPNKSVWPPHELFFNNRYAVPTNEYTIHQTIAPSAAVYALLSGESDGTFEPNQAPVLAIQAPTYTTSFTPGQDMDIQIDVNDPDGMIIRVEYYNGHHKIGETTSSPFNFTWTNIPADKADLKVIAYDNEGARTTRYAAVVQSLAMDKATLNLDVNSTYQLSAVPKPKYATEPIEWLSSDENIATVSATGLVTALSKGSVDITARSVETNISTICKVQVIDPLSIPAAANMQGITIYPNPLSSKSLTIELAVPGNEDLNISIYDVSGKRMFQETKGLTENRLVITPGLNPGLYVVKVSSSSQQFTSKLSVVR